MKTSKRGHNGTFASTLHAFYEQTLPNVTKDLHGGHEHALCREVVFGHIYSSMHSDLQKTNIIFSPAPSSAETLGMTTIY